LLGLWLAFVDGMSLVMVCVYCSWVMVCVYCSWSLET